MPALVASVVVVPSIGSPAQPEPLPKRSLGGKLREGVFARLLLAGVRGRRAWAHSGPSRKDGLEARKALAQAGGHLGIGIAGRRLVLAKAFVDGEVGGAGSVRVQSLMAASSRKSRAVNLSDPGRHEILAHGFARSLVRCLSMARRAPGQGSQSGFAPLVPKRVAVAFWRKRDNDS
jgi:hypothetical protein